MDKKKILTIGLITHNRLDLALKRIESIFNGTLPNWIEIIVVAEKNSDDKTWRVLEKLKEKYEFSLFSGRGKGFSDAFMHTILFSQGEYCMHLSDEDEILKPSLEKLKEFLVSKRPDILVSNYSIKNSQNLLKPYRINLKRKIRSQEFLKCSHNPGIIWNVDISKKIIKKNWNKWMHSYQLVSCYYPHFLLLLKILPRDKSWFYDELICYQSDFTQHQHKKFMNYEYHDLIPRWIQFNELNDFISSEIKKSNNQVRLNLEKTLSHHKSTIYKTIRASIESSNNDYLCDFDKGSLRSSLIEKNLIVSRLYRLFRHPRLSVIRIAKKIFYRKL